MEIIKPGSKIPFTRYRKIALIASTAVNLAVFACLFVKGPNLGVDFAGGTMVQLKFSTARRRSRISAQALETIDLGQQHDSRVRPGRLLSNFSSAWKRPGSRSRALGDQMKKALTAKFGADKFEIRRVEFVGPKIGEDLRWRGTVSVIAATAMMGVYIWIRFASAFGAQFGLHFGLGAVIALMHDVLVTVGALMLANYEFDLTVVAALLTIVGFSVNDTVVICDRIRENLRKIRRESLESIINTSLNETLSRTILTTGTALLVLLALYLLGGAVIRPFAFALLVGFVSGVYSTIFIASPVILLWEKSFKR